MRKKRNHQDESHFFDFLLRAGLWGGICYIGGFRGSELAKRALLGPVIEKVGGFTLEEALAAAQQERQRKELEESISHEIDPPLKSMILPEIKQTSENKDKLLAPLDALESKFDFLLPQPREVNDPDFRWLDLIVPPSIVLILGGKGGGKTALGFRFLEIFRNKLEPYVIALPKQCENLLPNWIGIRESLEEVPPRSISLVDEAYLTNHARDWAKAESREICRLLNLSRQQEKTIAFITQQSRHLNLDIVSAANVIVVKNPGMLQHSFERPELRKIMAEAKLAFDSIKGNPKAWSYVYSPDSFFHVYQMYVIRVKAGQEKRDALLTYLSRKGIMSKVYFHPVHLTRFYHNNLDYHCDLPVTEKISQQVLTLPMYPSLTENEIDYIADEIATFFS